MGRAPCCDKVGLKKGPWTEEEDQILISFIQQHGHSNWRALPKQAGLLRCGKSCRLRWINYLRPDIKRGNFSREEEDTIIQLHEMMGNRWSAIAARLPGRTDNEIKNVWHTHLKKRLTQYQPTKPQPKNGRKNHNDKNVSTPTTASSSTTESTSSENNFSENTHHHNLATSPQQSYTTSEDISSGIDDSSIELMTNDNNAMKIAQYFDDPNVTSFDYLPIIDETFWEAQELPLGDDNYNTSSQFSNMIMEDTNQVELLLREDNFAPIFHSDIGKENYCDDNMDFWLDVFVQAGGASHLPEF